MASPGTRTLLPVIICHPLPQSLHPNRPPSALPARTWASHHFYHCGRHGLEGVGRQDLRPPTTSSCCQGPTSGWRRCCLASASSCSRCLWRKAAWRRCWGHAAGCRCCRWLLRTSRSGACRCRRRRRLPYRCAGLATATSHSCLQLRSASSCNLPPAAICLQLTSVRCLRRPAGGWQGGRWRRRQVVSSRGGLAGRRPPAARKIGPSPIRAGCGAHSTEAA